MQVKNLLLKAFGGPIGVAAAILAVVGYNNKLEHVVVQSESHLIKCCHILI